MKAGNIQGQNRKRNNKRQKGAAPEAEEKPGDDISLEYLLQTFYPEMLDKAGGILTSDDVKRLSSLKWLNINKSGIDSTLEEVVKAIENGTPISKILSAKNLKDIYFSMPQMSTYEEGHQRSVEEEQNKGKGTPDPKNPCTRCKHEFFDRHSVQKSGSDEPPNYYNYCKKCGFDNK